MHHKLLTLHDVNVKFAGAKEGQFAGYASVFGGVDAYGDTIHAGAYERTLKERARPIQMRWNHFGDVIGKWTNMYEDEKGLYVEGELTPGHSKAMDVYASLKHGAISGLSIGYRPVRSVTKETGGEDLYEIDLIEISVVESPADLAAQIGDIKSSIDEASRLKELEAILRESGWSKENATWFVQRCKRLSLGEPDFEQKQEVQLTENEIALAFKLTQIKDLSWKTI